MSSRPPAAYASEQSARTVLAAGEGDARRGLLPRSAKAKKRTPASAVRMRDEPRQSAAERQAPATPADERHETKRLAARRRYRLLQQRSRVETEKHSAWAASRHQTPFYSFAGACFTRRREATMPHGNAKRVLPRKARYLPPPALPHVNPASAAYAQQKLAGAFHASMQALRAVLRPPKTSPEYHYAHARTAEVFSPLPFRSRVRLYQPRS